MKIEIYNKDNEVEIIVSKYVEDKELEFDSHAIVSEMMNRFGSWTTLGYIEVGYIPDTEKEHCPWYTMPKTIGSVDAVEGVFFLSSGVGWTRVVDEWIIYKKIVLKNGNILRNIGLIIEHFDYELTDEDKVEIKKVLKAENEHFAKVIDY